METSFKKNHSDRKLGLGVVLVFLGTVLFLQNAGVYVPHWILSWHAILLGVGLWIGYRRNFQGGGWLALTIIGAIFTLRDITVLDFEMSKITTAVVLIGLGLFVILKPKKLKRLNNNFHGISADRRKITNENV